MLVQYCVNFKISFYSHISTVGIMNYWLLSYCQGAVPMEKTWMGHRRRVANKATKKKAIPLPWYNNYEYL